jgi:NAD(P)-dependent dehydrogenase (short-subunit alcohol dehydrogenase family)
MPAQDRIALITGASQGIGAATARAFAAAGWRVALAARSAEKLDGLCGELGGRGSAFPCDVADPQSVDAMFAALRERFDRLDVVFNNAGANIPATLFGEIDYTAWRQVVSVNLDGAFLIADGAFRMMRDQDPQGGRIINNGSISAHAPRYGSAPYTASKHAITGLTKSIALDGRSCNVACGQIDIGNAASAMTARMSGGVPQADGTLKAEPTMDVRHVADAVLAMASLPLSANILFQTIMATDMPFVGRG